MKRTDLRHAQSLLDRIARADRVIQILNYINGGEEIAFPADIFEFVDREAAAKGLMSLVFECRAADIKALENLGVEYK